MSTPISVTDVTGISYRFAVRWSVPVEKLRYEPCLLGAVTPRVVKSNIYRFKGIENLEFSYLVNCYDNDYQMVCDYRYGLPIFLEDALVLIKDSIHRVKCDRTTTPEGLVFNALTLAHNWFQDDKVTFHCIMSIPAKIKAVISKPDEDQSAVNIVDCESFLADPGFHPYGYDAVNDFRYSSRIPDFNVDMAVRLIREAHQRQKSPNPHSASILKALCLEYLMENLTIENVTDILKQSIACDAKVLSERCVEFISENCQLVPLSD